MIMKQCVQVIKNCFLKSLYSPVCIHCRGAIDISNALCPQCWAQMKFIDKPYCYRLGIPLSYSHFGDEEISLSAQMNPPFFRRSRSAVLFDGIARDFIHKLKYGDHHFLVKGLSSMMIRAGTELLKDCDLIIPIPLHFYRQWKRRFNQAALLAHNISKQTSVPWNPLILKRIKNTKPHHSQSKDQRKKSLQGAYSVEEKYRPFIQGKNILLIDDVITSGATANSATATLLKYGAASVDILTFALTPPPDRYS